MTDGYRLAALREAFDRTFAQAPSPPAPDPERFLSLAVGTGSYVVRLAEVSGVVTGRKVTKLPGPVPELVGIAGLRGAIWPVFDLAMLLGLPAADAPRWLITAAAEPVAFAIERFDGYLQAPGGAPAAGSAPANLRHVREVVRVADGQRPLISLASVIDHVRQLALRDREA
jgi:chemotaxis signal transduction protein